MKIFRFKLPAIILLFLCINSCEYLDKQPDDQLTLDMVFRDKTRTEDWLAGVYSAIPDPYGMAGFCDGMGDDLTPSVGWEQFGVVVISYQKGNWSPSSTGMVNYWDELPKRIRSAYIFIDNVRPNIEQLVSEQEVTYMKAEAKFLIAYYHYLLLNYYGAITIQRAPTSMTATTDELMVGQDTYDEVIDWIDRELVEASKILPPTYVDAKKYGRATSIMCLAVRARMLMFAASPLVNGNPDFGDYLNADNVPVFNSTYDASKWKRAADACRDLIDLATANGHQLYYEYMDDGTIDPFMSYQNVMFKRFNEGNKELLFIRPECNLRDLDYPAQPRGTGGSGAMGVTQTLVDAFLMKNGLRPITGYNPDGSPIINQASGYLEKGFSTTKEMRKTKWIEVQGNSQNEQNPVTLEETYNMYCNREPRFYISVLYNDCWFRRANRKTQFYFEQPDGGPTHDAPQNGYLVRKKVHPDCDPLNKIFPYRPGILYRLAEIYLSYAEALNEMGYAANCQQVLEYLNLIRERAGVPKYGENLGEVAIPSTQESMREAIRHERRIELNCEAGIRFDDIRRWKLAEDLINKSFWGMNFLGTKKSDDVNDPEAFYVRKTYLERRFRSYWLPVPQTEIDKNPNLRQLPGWN